ncbi:hypothetical protein FGO68_gene8539 [Halteria grandinella]|uniref:Uncharacterized protein n=1 Tax=Halteria grandinella TaxID=5974 RepID=A0A8J8NGG1_HALGN|nr:hypothetical protein FGO68_gene8539 [Halteria grandinella]
MYASSFGKPQAPAGPFTIAQVLNKNQQQSSTLPRSLQTMNQHQNHLRPGSQGVGGPFLQQHGIQPKQDTSPMRMDQQPRPQSLFTFDKPKQTTYHQQFL